MRCIVTAGPTYEPLDQVRRLTNFSSGRLGSELALHLQVAGHDVTLLHGEQSTWSADRRIRTILRFSTTASLAEQLGGLSRTDRLAVFHTSAVSDFAFGRLWEVPATGERRELKAGKVSTRSGTLLAELEPTPKLISRLREWFPNGLLIGWKYEVDGSREAVTAKGCRQLEENGTNLCVANGPAYGEGFGIVNAQGEWQHCDTREELFAALSVRLAQS